MSTDGGVGSWFAHPRFFSSLISAAVIAKRLGLQLSVIHGEETKYAEALSEERFDTATELCGKTSTLVL